MTNAVRKRELNKAVNVIKQFGAKSIILFGSCARNEKNVSDIDIAVGGIAKNSFFMLAGRLIKELDVNVDLVDLDEADDHFMKRIKEEGKKLL